MSRFVTIDIDQGRMFLASAQVRANGAKLEHAIASFDIGQLSPASAPELGKRIRDVMKDAGIPAVPAIISVSRDRVVLKEIKFPAGVASKDEAGIIRFQAQKELTEGGENIVLDFETLPIPPEADGQRRALAVSMKRDILMTYQALCASAGLKLLGVVPRPHGLAGMLQKALRDGAVTPPQSPTSAAAVVALYDRGGEIVIVRNGSVVFSRSLSSASGNSEYALLGDIKRNIAVYQSQSPNHPVQVLYLAEAEGPGGWSGRVQDGLAIPVFQYDPLVGIPHEIPRDSIGSFAPLVGLLNYGLRPQTLPINFASPHQVHVEGAGQQRKAVFVAAALLVLLVGAFAFGRWQLSEKTKEADRLQAEMNQVEDQMKKLDPSWKLYKAVADWEGQSVNYLDELHAITARMDIKEMKLDSFVGQPEQAKSGKEKHGAKMEMVVSSSNQSMVDDFYRSIRSDPKYSIAGPVIKQGASATSTRSGGTPRQQHVVSTLVARRNPAEYKLQLFNNPAPRKEAPTGGLGGGMPQIPGLEGLGGFPIGLPGVFP